MNREKKQIKSQHIQINNLSTCIMSGAKTDIGLKHNKENNTYKENNIIHSECVRIHNNSFINLQKLMIRGCIYIAGGDIDGGGFSHVRSQL